MQRFRQRYQSKAFDQATDFTIQLEAEAEATREMLQLDIDLDDELKRFRGKSRKSSWNWLH